MRISRNLSNNCDIAIQILSQDEVNLCGWPKLECPSVKLIFEDSQKGFNTRVQADIIYDSVINVKGKILVHCYAGVSRSTAIAGAINYLLSGNPNWSDIAAQRQKYGIKIQPNVTVLKQLDNWWNLDNLYENYLKWKNGRY